MLKVTLSEVLRFVQHVSEVLRFVQQWKQSRRVHRKCWIPAVGQVCSRPHSFLMSQCFQPFRHEQQLRVEPESRQCEQRDVLACSAACWSLTAKKEKRQRDQLIDSMHTHMRGRTMERTRGVQILVGILIPDWLLMWCKAT